MYKNFMESKKFFNNQNLKIKTLVQSSFSKAADMKST